VRAAVLQSIVAIGSDPEQAGKELVWRLRDLWSARVGS